MKSSDCLGDVSISLVNTNHRISKVKKLLAEVIHGFYYFKRTAATHILVIIISPETRSRKPYALPVQCIPYKSLTDSAVWETLKAVIREMTELGMEVAGKYDYGFKKYIIFIAL